MTSKLPFNIFPVKKSPASTMEWIALPAYGTQGPCQPVVVMRYDVRHGKGHLPVALSQQGDVPVMLILHVSIPACEAIDSALSALQGHTVIDVEGDGRLPPRAVTETAFFLLCAASLLGNFLSWGWLHRGNASGT